VDAALAEFPAAGDPTETFVPEFLDIGVLKPLSDLLILFQKMKAFLDFFNSKLSKIASLTN
jgi:hypothetical protein